MADKEKWNAAGLEYAMQQLQSVGEAEGEIEIWRGASAKMRADERNISRLQRTVYAQRLLAFAACVASIMACIGFAWIDLRDDRCLRWITGEFLCLQSAPDQER